MTTKITRAVMVTALAALLSTPAYAELADVTYVGTVAGSRTDSSSSGYNYSWNGRLELTGGNGRFISDLERPWASASFSWWSEGCSAAPPGASFASWIYGDLDVNPAAGRHRRKPSKWQYYLSTSVAPGPSRFDESGAHVPPFEVPVTWSCPAGEPYTTLEPPSLTLGGSGMGTATSNSGQWPTKLTGAETNVDGQVTERFSWNLKAKDNGSLHADAAGPYRVRRGMRVRLDGSRSRGKIESYRWTFLRAAEDDPPANIASTQSGNQQSPPGTPCPKRVQPRRGRKKGAKVTAVALCTFKAKLTVSDGRHEDSQTAVVEVVPRNWVTPTRLPTPTYKSKLLGDLVVYDARDQALFGVNIPDCEDDRPAALWRDDMFCPRPRREGTTSWLNLGYRLHEVHDTGGPFDGIWHVDDPTFSVRRKVLLNIYMFEDAPDPKPKPGRRPPPGLRPPPVSWFDANLPRARAWIETIRQHETEGRIGTDGKPIRRSGHTQAVIEAMAADPTHADPRRAIEDVITHDRGDAQNQADGRLKNAGKIICDWQSDPLTDLWDDDPVLLWNGRVWTSGVEKHDPRTCTEPPVGSH